ncbi:hypothetical protein DFS33DRAFT_1117067 [Desarmillaria ectypa]|nr:hypothetical protein DFS33DRAFT_1117067 [Desarmillaria ectypa]
MYDPASSLFFTLMVEGYHGFIQATMRHFDLPLALQPYIVATEQLSVCDEHSFMRHLRTTVQSTGANVEHELQVKAVCHALLSFIGFETGSDVDDESRSVSYHISNFPDLEFELRVEATPHTEPVMSNVIVTLQWRQRKADWKLGASVVLISSILLTSDSGLLVTLLRELFLHRCGGPFKF